MYSGCMKEGEKRESNSVEIYLLRDRLLFRHVVGECRCLQVNGSSKYMLEVESFYENTKKKEQVNV